MWSTSCRSRSAVISRGRLEHLGRVAVDDLGGDDLVDDEVQSRIHRPPVDDQLVIPSIDRVVERGMGQADQDGALVRIGRIEQAHVPVLGRGTLASVSVKRRNRRGDPGVCARRRHKADGSGERLASLSPLPQTQRQHAGRTRIDGYLDTV